jgi:hypothetical protein
LTPGETGEKGDKKRNYGDRLPIHPLLVAEDETAVDDARQTMVKAENLTPDAGLLEKLTRPREFLNVRVQLPDSPFHVRGPRNLSPFQ